jgi:ankyrin repeat protein
VYHILEQDQKTALMIAAQGGHDACVSALVSHGADMNLMDRVGASCMRGEMCVGMCD